MDQFPKEVWFTLMECLKVPDMINIAFTCKEKLTVSNFEEDALFNRVDKNKIVELYYHENLDQKAYVKNGINYSPEFMLEKAEKIDILQFQFNKIALLTSLQVLQFHKKNHCINEQNLWKIETNFLSSLTKLQVLSLKNVHSVDNDIKYFSHFTNLHTLSLDNFYHHAPDKPLIPVFNAKELQEINKKYENPELKAPIFQGASKTKPQKHTSGFSFIPPANEIKSSMDKVVEDIKLGPSLEVNQESDELEGGIEVSLGDLSGDSKDDSKDVEDIERRMEKFIEEEKVKNETKILKESNQNSTAFQSTSSGFIFGNISSPSTTTTTTTTTQTPSITESSSSLSTSGGFKFGTPQPVIDAVIQPTTTTTTTQTTSSGFSFGDILSPSTPESTSSLSISGGGFTFGTSPAIDIVTQPTQTTSSGFSFGNLSSVAESSSSLSTSGGFKFGTTQSSSPLKTSSGFSFDNSNNNNNNSSIDSPILSTSGGFKFGNISTTSTATTETTDSQIVHTSPKSSEFSFNTPTTTVQQQTTPLQSTSPRDTSSGISFWVDTSNLSSTSSLSPTTNGYKFETTKPSTSSLNTSSGFSFDGHSTSATDSPTTSLSTSGGFKFETTQSSSPLKTSSEFLFGNISSPSITTTSQPSLKTSSSGFSFEAQPTQTTSSGFSFGNISSPSITESSSSLSTSGGFKFGTSQSSSPLKTSSGFSFDEKTDTNTQSTTPLNTVSGFSFSGVTTTTNTTTTKTSTPTKAKTTPTKSTPSRHAPRTEENKNINNNNNNNQGYDINDISDIQDLIENGGFGNFQNLNQALLANPGMVNALYNQNIINNNNLNMNNDVYQAPLMNPGAVNNAGAYNHHNMLLPNNNNNFNLNMPLPINNNNNFNPLNVLFPGNNNPGFALDPVKNYIEYKAEGDMPPKQSPLKVLSQILSSLPNLTVLNLHRVNFKIDIDVVHSLANCHKLRKLQIMQKEGFSKEGRVSGDNPNEMDVSVWSSLKQLTILSITSDVVNLDRLTTLTSLKILYFQQHGIVFKKSFVEAGNLSELVELSFEHFPPHLLNEINKNLSGFPVNFKTNDFFERLKNLRLHWGIWGFGSDIANKVENIKTNLLKFTSLQNLIVDSYFRRKIDTTLGSGL